MSHVLITYFTRTNTTKDICERIGAKLEERGHQVKIMPFAEVGDGSRSNIDSFDAVVVGAPINGMRWVEEAKEFVVKNAGIMQSKKVALFYVSYLLDNGYGIWQKSIHGSLKKLVPLVDPLAVGEFKGRVDKPFTGFIRLMFGSRKDEPADRTDWDHVDEFAENLGRLFQ